MQTESYNVHSGLGKFVVLMGILATVVAAIAVVGKRRVESRGSAVVDGWEDDVAA
jgi:hypothetical protein